MSESNRGKRRADLMQWGGGAITLAIAFIVTWLIASQYGESRGYSESQTEHAANSYTKEIDRTCINPSESERALCSYEIQKSAVQAQHDAHDLEAQRISANSTWWTAAFAGIGVFLTIVGIGFLRANLIEMQRQREATIAAVKAAERGNEINLIVGKKQTKAYLTCKSASLSVERRQIVFRPIIENKGQSPALTIKLFCQITVLTPFFGSILPEHQDKPRHALTEKVEGWCPVIASQGDEEGFAMWFNTQMGKEAHGLLYDQDCMFTIDCKIVWTDVFGEEDEIMVYLSEKGISEITTGLALLGSHKIRKCTLDAHNRHEARYQQQG